jgi:hypothetical protein
MVEQARTEIHGQRDWHPVLVQNAPRDLGLRLSGGRGCVSLESASTCRAASASGTEAEAMSGGLATAGLGRGALDSDSVSVVDMREFLNP